MHQIILNKQTNLRPTSNKPTKNAGEISDNFSTARRDTEIMLNVCTNTNNSSIKTFDTSVWTFLSAVTFNLWGKIHNEQPELFKGNFFLNCAYNCVWPAKPVESIYGVFERVPNVFWRLRFKWFSRSCIHNITSTTLTCASYLNTSIMMLQIMLLLLPHCRTCILNFLSFVPWCFCLVRT